ncbi:hypothetical protein U1707_08205 [Sphingomonas sp. PB2P12]|uniref:hypothetical protein n=1 Tax=Sphingomonas sandaracina TaxID=3096157 RepID=UPI002FC7D647
MTYTDFAEKLLIALYQESEAGRSDQRFEDMLAKYGLPKNAKWLERLTEEWKANGFVNVDAFIGSPLLWYAEIAGAGMRYIESKFRSKDGVGELLAPLPALPEGEEILTFGSGEPLQFENGEYLTVTAPPPETMPPKTYDSSDWTGLPSQFVLTEQKNAKLVALLENAERELDSVGAGNQEKAMARAYIVAARCLADAPEPPVDLIWEIINRANNLAGVASLLVSIIALFTAAH